MPKYILIAGVNGAGKSTLYYILDNLHDMPRINIDEIVREFGDWKNPSDVMEAGKFISSSFLKSHVIHIFYKTFFWMFSTNNMVK